MNRTKILEQATKRLDKINQLILDINVKQLDPLRECAIELEITESRISQLYARIEAKLHDTYAKLYSKKSTPKHNIF